MIVKMTKPEMKTLEVLDPEKKGAKNWLTARAIAAGVFKKKEENLSQEQIRVVRNSLRKPVREQLVEMSPTVRGEYRISDRGRKLLSAGATEFEGLFERGEATLKSKEAAAVRMGSKPKAEKKAKPSTKKTTKKAKKAPAKKASTKKKAFTKTAAPVEAAEATKKAPKKAKAKKAPAKKAKAKAKTKTPNIVIEDKTSEATESAEPTNGSKRLSGFKRRAVPAKYGEQVAN